MAYDRIHELITAISPETYCRIKDDPQATASLVSNVRKTVTELGYAKTVDTLKLKAMKATDYPLYNYDDAKKDALGLWGLASPLEQHEIVYDSPAEGLEPIYFWLLDFLNGPYRSIEKLIDNFQSSPGSGHFSELQGKATQMQQEVSRTMGNVNTVLKSVLNLVYDLKEFNLRLEPYNTYKKTMDEKEKYTKLLALKQVWLDNVDIRKGRGSINALSSGELDFVTLRDAFMALKSKEHVAKLDLNDRVRRILEQRADEFFRWIDESHASLEQRYNIEKNYLRSQVNMLKLYTRWVRPYLEAAAKLQKKVGGISDPRLVTAFNSTVFELVLLATSKPYDVTEDVIAGLLPDVFNQVKTRKYFKVLVVEFEFRSIPQRVSQRGDWSFGGRTAIKFTSYALNEEELEVLRNEIDKDEFQAVMALIQGATDDSLKQIEKDIDDILEGKKKEEKPKEEKKRDDSITGIFKPFLDAFKPAPKGPPKTKEPSKGILPDDTYEKVVRSQAAIAGRETCFTVFDIYKRAHGMPSHQSHFDPL